MKTLPVCFAFIIVVLLQFAVPVYAGSLDDYYLQQFGEAKSVQLQKALLSVTAETADAVRCGTPLKHGLRRDWDQLESVTQKILAKQLALPTLTGEATYTSSGGHYRIHYATSGTDAPPLADLNGNKIPEWVETVAKTFEDVYASYSSRGYQLAPTSPVGSPYDIYLRDLAPQGFYGVTTSNQSASSAIYKNSFTSWMELDNNFTDSVYKPNTYTPLQSLQITAAHEYHHAIQYGYTFFFDVWYAEATSTWMEDELYDNINQLYNYIPGWLSNSTKALDLTVGSDATTSGAGYGRWIFNRFLDEKYGTSLIRSVWEKAGGLTSPGGNADIPMIPVLENLLASPAYGSTLGTVFVDFAKRIYKRDWSTHTSETDKIHLYSPYATFTSYPVNSKSSPFPAVTLPHYSFAFYKFTPAVGTPTLTITLAKSSGIRTAAFRKSHGVITEISADSGGNSYTDFSFSSDDEVVLLIANATNSDGQNANFSTDSTITAVTEPPPPPVASLPADTNGVSTTGCFIATAAYGSYLHPHVQLLRNFRDQYLLTNAPGRVFVAGYYRYSPPFADFIARHALLRGITRLLLSPLVAAVAAPLLTVALLILLVGVRLMVTLRRSKATRTTLNSRHHSHHIIPV